LVRRRLFRFRWRVDADAIFLKKRNLFFVPPTKIYLKSFLLCCFSFLFPFLKYKKKKPALSLSFFFVELRAGLPSIFIQSQASTRATKGKKRNNIEKNVISTERR